MAQIKGTVTRVVEERGKARRVFFQPSGDAETQETLRYVDGSIRLASGEIAVETDDDAEVGKEFTGEVECALDDREEETPRQPARRRRSEPTPPTT